MTGRVTFGADDATDKLASVGLAGPESMVVNRSAEALSEACLSSAQLSLSLIDPDLQDLSHNCRNYIRYCKAKPELFSFKLANLR